MQRNTQQREAIREVLAEAGRPLSPHEVLDRGRGRVPRLGIATVYRTLKSLVDEGWLRTVDLPGAPSRYELSGKSHHHHFHCRRCDRLYEVEDCPGRIAGMTPRGFTLEAHDLILYGLCNECQA